MIEIVESSRLLGITKEITKQLEALPLAAHGAVLGCLNTMAQHRELSEKQLREAEVAEKNEAIHQRQVKMMEAEQARQAADQLARANANLPKVVLA